jgi:hypothetical protein
VQDVSSGPGRENPTALSLHLFESGTIPIDRFTNYKSLSAVDNVYSQAITLHNFDEGPNYFSVRCEAMVSRRFRVVVFQSEANIEPGHEYHGEVCPGDWA